MAPRAAAGRARGPSRLAAVAILAIIGFGSVVEATHFRYGSIHWVPRVCDPSTNTSPRALPNQPTSLDNCNPLFTGGVVVEFTVQLAFRRDYTWGQFFGEQWSNQVNGAGGPVYSTTMDNAGNFQQFTLPAGQPITYYQTQFDQDVWKIKFPSGYGSSYSDMPLSTDPTHQIIGNSYPTSSGRLCDNPYDDGLLPKCNGTVTVATDTDKDPRTDGYIPYFPYYASGAVLPAASCSCTLPEMAANQGTCNTGCTMECTTDEQTPAFLGGSSVCAPWAYSFGFFTGVEDSDGHPDYSKTLEISLKSIDMDTNSKIGNFITGEGKVYQQYDTPLIGPGSEPWVAYFTGGDRIGKADGGLQNNFGGRFRLEVSVNLECHDSGKCWQKSPRATSLPVVPIPYTARNGYSLYDFSFSTFRIAAYDPDIGDSVYFYHASNQKYGVHVGHGIPEGDYPNNPTPLEYNNAYHNILSLYCLDECSTCPSPLTYTGPGGTVQTIENFCAEYPKWTHGNVGLHTAGPPPRLMIDAYTGVVHWQTGASPFADDNTTYLLPQAFPGAPQGTVTPYVWELPGGGLYDGWVYNPKTFSYSKYSDFSTCDGSGGPYSGTCTTKALSPGFYNLVVDVRSQSGDRCLSRDIPSIEQCMSLEDLMEAEANGDYTGGGGGSTRVSMTDPLAGPFTPAPGQNGFLSSKRGYNSSPLDFLIYLYPSISMCANCNNNSYVSAGEFVGDGVVTFKDSTGTYGFDVTQETINAPNVDKYVHQLFEGTGRCIICGGSETNSSQVDQDQSVCTSCLVPTTAQCTRNTRPFWINKDYTINDDPYTPAPTGWDSTTTRPTGNINLAGPTWGEIEVAQVNAFKGSVVEFDLVAGDEDDCVELWIYDTGLYKGEELDFCQPFANADGNNDAACDVLDSGGAPGILDDLSSDFDPSINMFDMYLGPHQPAYVPNYSGPKPDVLGEPGKTVRRQFRWPAVTGWPSALEADYDPRPVDSTVCFFAFDGYLFSDFRCIRITLNTEQQIYWSDRRPGLDPLNVWNVVQNQKGFNTGTFNAIVDGSSTNITAPVTLANNTRIVVNVGDMVTFDVQAKQASGYDPMDIFISQGVLPEGATFVKDIDYNSDPVKYTFSWRPTKGQECEYQICFLASNIRGTEYPMTVGYGDLISRLGPKAPAQSSYTPSTASSATAPFIDERCYTIEVTDMAAHLTDGAYIDVDAASATSLVSTLDGDCGYSVGGWFLPQAGATNDMALVSIGHAASSTSIMDAEHQLRWMYVAASDDIAVGTDSVPFAESGTQYRALAFYEDGANIAFTQPVECDGGWHYFFATVDDSKTLRLYLDGTELTFTTPDSREFMQPGTVQATVSAFPAELTIPTGSLPSFRLGADNTAVNFDGWLNDIRVYSRALSADEVQDQMFATCTNDDTNRDNGECLALGDEVKSKAAKTGLELWLNFNDANNANPSGNVSDPLNGNVIHGCTSDALPTGASFSRYLSCFVDRNTRDLAEFGGTWEYCNDYRSLIGDRSLYRPDMYDTFTAQTELPQCLEHQCYAKEGPTCGGAPAVCNAATDFTSADLVCSYQCADIDNSFHGSGYSTTNPVVTLQMDDNRIPYVSAESTLNNWEVVGDLREMDTPYSPYLGEMFMNGGGATLTDRSMKGRTASAYLTATDTGTATLEYKVSPAFSACPAIPVPNVVHVDGGQDIVLRGSNFAESKFLRCHFSGMTSTPATVVEYDSRGGLSVPSAIKCQAPGGFGAATAAAIDVSNNGANYTDFNIPIYFTESAAYFDGTKLMQMDPVGTTWADNGFSVGMWFNMHDPPTTRFNGLLLTKPVLLMALEWDSGATNDRHLTLAYNTLAVVPGGTGNALEVYSSGVLSPLVSTTGTVGDDLATTHGSTGWHYVMVTISTDGILSMYLDGALAGTAALTNVPAADAKMWFGGRVGDFPTLTGTTLGQYSEFVGYLDELSIFTKEVSACEGKHWMWGNLTRSYSCPSGEIADLDKEVYEPIPTDLLAHFSFDGLSYDHGFTLSAAPFSLQTWNFNQLRYTDNDPGASWKSDMFHQAVRIYGALSDGSLAGNTVSYGVLDLDYNLTEAPELKFVTTPFLAPSFNAPRRKICGSVLMATASRAQAVTTSGASLSSVGNFGFVDVNFVDNSGSGGYSGSVATVAEPTPVPNRCEANHGFLVDAVVPVEGYHLPEPWSPSLNTCEESGVTVYGYGFAKSPWLTCMQGDQEGEMEATSAHFINEAEIRCTAAGTELPYKYKFGVSNNYVPVDADCEGAPEATVVETPEMLHTKDVSMYFDGVQTYAMARGVSDGLDKAGVTFGAWFFPTRAAGSNEEEPILAFSTECGSTVPLFNSADGAPPVAVIIGATYSDGKVCLTSDLPYYSQQDIPAHPELDLPTKWDSTYGLLDTTNSSLCLEAAAGMWHYVQIAVNPKEILMDIASDEPKVSYLATLTVDGETIGGDEDGGDSSLRVPALPVGSGSFFVGGLHCPVSTASASSANSNDWEGENSITDFHMRYFQGIIDEVRVYKGVQSGLDWLTKALPHPDMVAYYTFTVSRGDNQRRQTPHCEEFAAGTEPKDCIVGGMYFSRAVEEYWIDQPAGLRYNSDTLATYPNPTGYYPVARGSPLRPTVYPQLVTHTDPLLSNGVDICDLPTTSDASYAGTSFAHQNLLADSSFPINFAVATKQPYVQGGPGRYSQFISADATLYNYALGPDMGTAPSDGAIYVGNVVSSTPDYRYMEVPWYAATIEDINTDASALDGGRHVTVTAYNAAPSKWLSCKFRGLEYEDHAFSIDADSTRFQDIASVGDFLPAEADTVTCPFPGTTDPSDSSTEGSDWLKVPSLVSMQLVNPKAVDSELVIFKEMALKLDGNFVNVTDMVYASENFHHSLRLECPEGLRFENVLFANYGRPQNRCNKQSVSLCNGTVEEVDCDWAAWKVTKSCDSDHKKPDGFTAGIVDGYCFGKSMCSIPAKDEIFGDPCSGKNKWLAVAYQCTDRWMAKDYAMLSDANAARLGDLLNPVPGEVGEYSFAAWVKPGSMLGQQSVASFGCKDCAKMNRGILQWIGLEDNVGMFHYYDDYINDVVMKRADGSNIMLASDQWYYVAWTIDSNNEGALYLNGHQVASFSTASRPVGSTSFSPTFTIGMDLDDNLQPKEFFSGMVDEVRIFNRALTREEVFSSLYWTMDMGSDLYSELVAYYKFNNMAEEDTAICHDETPNNLDLILASSTVDVWDASSMSYSGSGENHVSLEAHGAAWFPATTYAIDSDWETAPLGAGLSSFEVHGVNFVPGMSRVYISGEDVTESVVSMTDDTVTMNIPEAECTGSNSNLSVYVANLPDGISIAVPEETIVQEASVPDLQSGLICYFPFFGNAYDWSGNGNDAELVDGADLTINRNSLENHAYYFDGGDAILVPDCVPSALTGKSIKTVAMWVKYADLQFPLQCSSYPNFEEEIGFQDCVMEDHAIMTNSWKLIAGVVDDSSTKIFVNGVEHVSQTEKLPEYLDLIHHVVLLQEIGGDDFVGVIDDVWIYDRELCAAELMKLYTTQRYAISMDGSGGLSASILSGARMGSPGLKVTLISSTAPGLTSDSVTTELVVDLPETNSDLINPSRTGALDRLYPVVVPTASTTDGFSMIVEGSVYAPSSGSYTFAVTCNDQVYCWLKDDSDNTLFTITSGQKDVTRTMERTATLTAGEWYGLRCAYTKLPNDLNLAANEYGQFGIRWHSTSGQVNGPLSGPYVRTGGAAELVVAAWIHPEETEGRVGVMSLMGDSLAENEMARFGLSIVDGSLSAGFYTGAETAACNSAYYREVTSWKSAIMADTWQHVVVAYNGTTMSFFVDGRMTDEVTFDTHAYMEFSSDVKLLVGADASASMFKGQIYSVAMYNKVKDPTDMANWVRGLWECPLDGPEKDLILNLALNEGVGMMAKDFSATLDHPTMRPFGDAQLSAAATWVDATCGTLGTHVETTEYAGQGLVEGLAGQCMVFSVEGYDKCGTKRLSGGDNFTVEVVGPLHLHAEIYELTVGNGIEDMGDGSYLVHFTREISGYYLVYVKLDGVIVRNSADEEATKTYVHPYVTDAMSTYMYDEADMLGLDELRESCAGVPVAYMIQTVDAYKNLRTTSCDTDAFEVSFEGPYSFEGAVANLYDGTFRVNYNAEVAGPYQMHVTAAVASGDGTEEMPVYHYGGRTCAGWGQSELDYCTLYDMPEILLSGDDYPICLTVHECGSLRTYKDSIYASFPDTDDLDLEGPFTMSAWIKPVPETGEASRQYILSKQSEYSGKGYWLAIMPTAVATSYMLELGIYVGSENYRIVKTPITIPAETWTRVGATYDGQMAHLFKDGNLMTEFKWMDEDPLFQRRNAQPLRVGKQFSGMIDSVMLYSAALPEKLTDMASGKCPAMTTESHEDLVAYYRFNEGATRDMDGNMVAQNNAWATKDASGKGNDGFVGLFSDETSQNKEMTIKCPAGYVISEVLFANYGSSKGGYGTYQVDECGAANSMSFVESKCLGQTTCKVLAAYTNFGNPCKHGSKTLAVNAICAQPTPDASMASWAIGDPAPHWVGTAAPPAVSCPYEDMAAIPDTFKSILPNNTCADWDITHTVAGETEYFMLKMVDMCGYKNRYPMKVDGYTTVVDTSIMLLGGASTPYEPVFASGVSGLLSYPLEFISPSIDQCGIASQPEADVLSADFMWGAAYGGFDMYCSRYRDLYLGMFTPSAAHEAAVLDLNLSVVDGDVFESITVDVAPAAIDAASSSTCAPTETAPNCASGACGDIMAEAGVEAMFEFVAMDEFGNQLRTWDHLAMLSVMVEDGQSAIHTVIAGSEEGIYEFYIIFPHEGNFTVTIKADDDIGCSFSAVVTAAVPHTAVVYGLGPGMRFEHSMVEKDHNLYVFGGASKDMTYLSETWKLNTGYSTFAQGFNYRRSVHVEGLDGLSAVPSTHVVKVYVPTAAWMTAGKLQADCADLLLLTETGMRMDFWVEPTGAPNGCGAEMTTLWVEVAGSQDSFHLYYGNKGFDSYSSPAVFSKDGMGMFEDFEYSGSPLDNGWTLSSSEHDTCTPLEPGQGGDPMAFITTEAISLSGERSLAVDALSKVGGSIKMAGMGIGKSFTMKGYLFDTLCTGYHYLSPDFDVCQPVNNAKSMLPGTKNAMGVYTDAKSDQYCYTYPWIRSGSVREVGWHSFMFVGSEDELKLYVDEELIATTEATEYSSMYIAGGAFVDDLTGGTKAYWDSIFVTLNHDGVTSSMEEEEAVFFDEAHQWMQVGVLDPPPARQAHTAVVYSGDMYIYGGERSAYEYSDIWKYDTNADVWEFVAPRNSSAALARHDHSAVVYGDAMYVYGGRSPMPKGDFWAYSFSEGTWTEIPASPGMAARFGHGAAVVDGKMYVYGGYMQGTDGMSGSLTDEIWSFGFEGMSWTKVGPRVDNFMQGASKAYIADPYDAMMFPQMLPDARFSSVIVGRVATNSFYVLGGAGGDSMMDLLSDVAGFSTDAKQWSTPHMGWSDVETAARYDAAGALIDDMWACTYGGMGGGEYLNSMVCLFVGDHGLSSK